MLPRSASIRVSYNGKDITDSIGSIIKSASYTDPASGESDTLDLTLSDRDQRWIKDWLPEKGAVLTASLSVQNWDADGDTFVQSIGSFTLDRFSFTGMPLEVTLSGISAPLDKAFSATERTKTWEQVTLQQIASDIAGRAGLSVFYDADEITIKAAEQSEQTDSDFLEQMCEKYNICLKVYDKKLVLFSRKRYKEKAAAVTFRGFSAFESLSWETSLPYTGASLTYTDPDKEEEVTYKTGTDERLLTVSDSADSAADAQLKCEAALEEANHSATTLTVTVKGLPTVYAGQCAQVTGCGAMDGKYYIDKVTHSIGSGFTTDLEMSRIGG